MNAPAPATPIVEVEALTKHFPAPGKARVHAVEQVSLQVGRGETLAIVGESGCGKSTLAYLIIRLLDPTSGTIRLDGTDITGLGVVPVHQPRPRGRGAHSAPRGCDVSRPDRRARDAPRPSSRTRHTRTPSGWRPCRSPIRASAVLIGRCAPTRSRARCSSLAPHRNRLCLLRSNPATAWRKPRTSSTAWRKPRTSSTARHQRSKTDERSHTRRL